MLKWFYDKFHSKDEYTSPLMTDANTQLEAKVAVQEANDKYDQAVATTPRVNEIVSALHDQRERNHFAEMIERTMKGSG